MCLLYDGFFCRRSAEVGLFYIPLKFLSLCFHQFFNVAVFVTDHFEVDTITYTIVTVGIMSGIIENVDDFSFIHPVVRGFIIRNTKGSIGIQTVITIIWITQFKTTAVSGNASRSKF